jgi:hypothetical protein
MHSSPTIGLAHYKFDRKPVKLAPQNCQPGTTERTGIGRRVASHRQARGSGGAPEGIRRLTTNELLAFLAIARGSGGEVRSMMAVVKDRPKLKPHLRHLQDIRALAESCARQLTAWTGSLEASPVQGKRHLAAPERERREVADKARSFRMNFLRNLKPDHPLYSSPEARAARGEPVLE